MTAHQAEDFPDITAALRRARDKFGATHVLFGALHGAKARSVTVYAPRGKGWVTHKLFSRSGLYHWPKEGRLTSRKPQGADSIDAYTEGHVVNENPAAERRPRGMGGNFTKAYIETALWSSTDDTGEPLDKTKSERDISPSTLYQMKKDAALFQERYSSILTENDDSRGGHDFWLTRNGHGAGFWDGDWPVHGDELTKASKSFGTFELYVGDDGKIYASGYEEVNEARAPRGKEATRETGPSPSGKTTFAAWPQVRFRFDDETEWQTSSLTSFLQNNHLYEEDERALRAGDRVTLGGGAAPLVHVELVRENPVAAEHTSFVVSWYDDKKPGDVETTFKTKHAAVAFAEKRSSDPKQGGVVLVGGRPGKWPPHDDELGYSVRGHYIESGSPEDLTRAKHSLYRDNPQGREPLRAGEMTRNYRGYAVHVAKMEGEDRWEALVYALPGHRLVSRDTATTRDEAFGMAYDYVDRVLGPWTGRGEAQGREPLEAGELESVYSYRGYRLGYDRKRDDYVVSPAIGGRTRYRTQSDIKDAVDAELHRKHAHETPQGGEPLRFTYRAVAVGHQGKELWKADGNSYKSLMHQADTDPKAKKAWGVSIRHEYTSDGVHRGIGRGKMVAWREHGKWTVDGDPDHPNAREDSPQGGEPFSQEAAEEARRKIPPFRRELEFSGYKFTSSPEGTTIHRGPPIDTSVPGDYGADPLGDGKFRMIPSGDIVDETERYRRLARFPSAREGWADQFDATLKVGDRIEARWTWGHETHAAPARVTKISKKSLRAALLETYSYGASGGTLPSGKELVLPRVGGEGWSQNNGAFPPAGHTPRVGRPSALRAGQRQTSHASENGVHRAPPAAQEGDAVPWVRITRDPKLYEEGIKRAKEIGPIDGGRQIYELLSPALSVENQEVFLVVLCNLRQECIGVAEVHRGERSRVSVSRADILQVVTKSGADHFHVVHNHPSGDPTPSDADRKLTKAIQSGADEVEIPCVDHVVIGMGKFYSFADGKVTKVL